MVQILGDSLGDNIAAMQAAYLEWQHGKGAEEAMLWIVNTLSGPGLIPGMLAEVDEWERDHSDWATNPQLWFAAHKSRPFPTCPCGRPSSHAGSSVGWCSPEHQQLALDKRAVEQEHADA